MDSIHKNEGVYGIARWVVSYAKLDHEYDRVIFCAMLKDKEKTLKYLEAAMFDAS